MRRHRDVLLAIALALGTIAEVAAGHESGAVGVPLALLACLPLAVRRRHPIATIALQSLAFAAYGAIAVQPPNFPVVAEIIGVFTVGAHVAGRRAYVALALVVVAVFVQMIAREELDDAIWVAVVIFTPPFAAGRALGARRAQVAELEAITTALEAERARAAELAEEAERARLAREMHDVLSHGTSLIVLQAGAGAKLAHADPEGARQALSSIEGAAREALAELETALGRAAPAPPLESLAERVRAAGIDVRMDAAAAKDLGPGLQITVRRVVQEALTNVLKHAGATEVDVRVRRDDGVVWVTVADDGRGATGELASTGSGRGLTGMHERAGAYGGSVEAGPLPQGGFCVSVALPLEGVPA